MHRLILNSFQNHQIKHPHRNPVRVHKKALMIDRSLTLQSNQPVAHLPPGSYPIHSGGYALIKNLLRAEIGWNELCELGLFTKLSVMMTFYKPIILSAFIIKSYFAKIKQILYRDFEEA
jgi:hypothetical protein